MTTPSSQTDGSDVMEQVKRYHEALSAYAQIKAQIHQVLGQQETPHQDLSDAHLAHYQDLARRRDEALSEIRWLEQLLLDLPETDD